MESQLGCHILEENMPQLQDLCFDMDLVREETTTVIDDLEVVQTSLANSLSNFRSLKGLSLNFIPTSQPIFDAMNANNAQLNHFGTVMYYTNNDTVDETITSNQTSPVVSTISSLALHFYNDPREDITNFSSSLADVCGGFDNLATLDITCAVGFNFPNFVVELLLQNIPVLQSLIFKIALVNDTRPSYDTLYNRTSSVQTASSLESIKISHYGYAYRGSNWIKKTICLFSFILRSCPKLKKFDLSTTQGRIRARGKINFDFRKNHSLRFIRINVPNCRYYTFDHEFGKLWRNVNHQIKQEEFTEEQKKKLPFFVNLAWDTALDIEIQLAGYGM